MTRTTELLKEIDNLKKIHIKKAKSLGLEDDGTGFYDVQELEAELKGRLDALKEEVKGKKQDYEDWRWVYLTANEGRIKINAEKIMNKKSEELASIQEEIKLIESTGVGK